MQSPHPSKALVLAACRRIEEAEEAVSLDALAAEAGLSPFHFHREFKRVVGVTPKAYASEVRAGRVRSALLEKPTVTEALYEAGYGGSGRFYEDAGRVLGMTPTAYRRGGKAETIRFAVGRCSLGDVLVAATDKGVCTIAFGDDGEALVKHLEERFPEAELVGGDEGFEALVARVVALVEKPWAEHDLPLDVRGTAFQRRVWDALRKIRPGEPISYAELARRIGAPSSVRAVAGACAANALAVAIPCHRVVRTGGGLSGYRWGVERKQALLERERGAPLDG